MSSKINFGFFGYLNWAIVRSARKLSLEDYSILSRTFRIVHEMYMLNSLKRNTKTFKEKILILHFFLELHITFARIKQDSLN